MVRSVLFVCMGNICRSPAAEAVFRAHAEAEGLAAGLTIDSAGTIGYHSGSPADARMRRAATRRGYEVTSIARQVTADDLGRFDLVVAMDRDNLRDLEDLAGDRPANLRLHNAFLDGGAPPDVPDPYYGGDAGFDQVLDLLERAAPEILAYLADADR